METKTFHLALKPTSAALAFYVNGEKYPVTPHNAGTLAAATNENAVLQKLSGASLQQFTHFVSLNASDLPSNTISRLQIVEDIGNSRKLPPLHFTSFYVPHPKRTVRAGVPLKNGGLFLDPKLQYLGCCNESLQTCELGEAVSLNTDADLLLTPWDVAKSLVFHHPDLLSQQLYTASIVMDEHIAPAVGLNPEQYNFIYELAICIQKQGADKWATRDVSKDFNNNIFTYEYEVEGHKVGDPVEIYCISEKTRQKMGAPINGALATARDDQRLQNSTWSVLQSETSTNSENHARFMQNLAAASNGPTPWSFSGNMNQHGVKVFPNLKCETDSHVIIEVVNNYLRTLGAYVCFKDENDKPLKDYPWKTRILDGYETDEKKFLCLLNAGNHILGIPCPTKATSLDFSFPSEACAAEIYFAGLGYSNFDHDIDTVGTFLTYILQYAFPLLSIAAGEISSNIEVLQKLISKYLPEIIILAAVSGFCGIVIGADLDKLLKVIFALSNMLAGLILKCGIKELVTFVAKKFTSRAIASIPFLGWVITGFSVAIGMTAMAVTTGEVLSSPAVMHVKLQRKTDVRVTVRPDPKKAQKGKPDTATWPSLADSCHVVVRYKTGINFEHVFQMERTTSSKPLIHLFTELPAGGKIQIVVNVYAKNDWLCGFWMSDWISAIPETGSKQIVIEGAIQEMLVPLSAQTQYHYKETMSYNGATDQYGWAAREKPTATLAVLDKSGVGNQLCSLAKLSYNELYKQIGYTWEASGSGLPPVGGQPGEGLRFVAQNISGLQEQESCYKCSEVGFYRRPLLAYDRFGTGEKNFLLDTRGDSLHLRKVHLGDGLAGFGLQKEPLESWGRFTQPYLDDLVVHPDGVAIGVNWKHHVLEILELSETGCSDESAPRARQIGGKGIRQGLLGGPAALSVTSDKRILVLETLNRRIQAFDLNGNPVPSFSGARVMSLPAAHAQEFELLHFSDAAKKAFLRAGCNRLATLSIDELPEDALSQLDLEQMTKDLLEAFSACGIYLSFDLEQLDNPAVSPFVTRLEAGARWTITDPNTTYVYNLEKDGQALVIQDWMEHVEVQILSAGKRWKISDLKAAFSYLVTKQQDNTLLVQEYLPWFPIHETPGADTTYLDLASEEKGYIYLLSYLGSGEQESDYHIDIYCPDGSFLVRTPEDSLPKEQRQHPCAARFDVNRWRDVYTLNYESMQGRGGKTEPTVSRWIPSAPETETK